MRRLTHAVPIIHSLTLAPGVRRVTAPKPRVRITFNTSPVRLCSGGSSKFSQTLDEAFFPLQKAKEFQERTLSVYCMEQITELDPTEWHKATLRIGLELESASSYEEVSQQLKFLLKTMHWADYLERTRQDQRYGDLEEAGQKFAYDALAFDDSDPIRSEAVSNHLFHAVRFCSDAPIPDFFEEIQEVKAMMAQEGSEAIQSARSQVTELTDSISDDISFLRAINTLDEKDTQIKRFREGIMSLHPFIHIIGLELVRISETIETIYFGTKDIAPLSSLLIGEPSKILSIHTAKATYALIQLLRKNPELFLEAHIITSLLPALIRGASIALEHPEIQEYGRMLAEKEYE